MVWINDCAIDVSDYERWHPGGEVVLREFIGRDATTPFFAMHPASAHAWLKARKVDTKKAPPAPACNAALRDDYVRLHEAFRARGWLDPSLRPLLMCFASSVPFLLLAAFCPWDSSGRLHPILLGFFAGMFWHQLAFSLHDVLHGEIFRKKSTAHLVGYLLALVLGFLSSHWDEEHLAHHVMSNDVDHDLQQNNSPLITVDRKQITEKRDQLNVAADVRRWLLKTNHWFWLIAATWGGRFALQIVAVVWALKKPRTRLWQIGILVCHYVLLAAFLRSRSGPFVGFFGVDLGPWLAGLVMYLTVGALHIQLLINHASRPMTCDKDSHLRSAGADWVSWQADATADIHCPWWADWYHGGLQFQITHHLFPRLRSDRLRLATIEVYALLRRHKEPVNIHDGLIGGVIATAQQLATPCKEAGHKPWFVGVESLAFPNIFWIVFHVVMLLVLPLAGIGDGWYAALWSASFFAGLGILFAPLVGLA